jgi:hypothetical protein
LDNVPCYGPPQTPEGKSAEQKALERAMYRVGGEPVAVKKEIKQEAQGGIAAAASVSASAAAAVVSMQGRVAVKAEPM